MQYHQLILSHHYIIVRLLAQIPFFFWPCLQYHQNISSCFLISPNILSTIFVTNFLLGHLDSLVLSPNFGDNIMSPKYTYISPKNGVVKSLNHNFSCKSPNLE